MMKDWPDKEQREADEIKEFVSAYKKLPSGRAFEIVRKQEKPDYIVKDVMTGEKFGVELTSVYSSDRSVPDIHRKPHNGPVPIHHNQKEIDSYKERLLEAIKKKNIKAKGYAQDYPLLLSVYVNEYCAIFIDDDEWEGLVKTNESFFDSMCYFSEIVFWNFRMIRSFPSVLNHKGTHTYAPYAR